MMNDSKSSDLKERARMILNDLTVEQKIGQVLCMFAGGPVPSEVLKRFVSGLGEVAILITPDGKEQTADEVEKIQEMVLEACGIPAIVHAEALSGYLHPDATVFPSAIGLAATWNPENVEEMTTIIRKQMQATGVYQALSPVMDVARDPRWGRVAETYGEDPSLVSAMSVAFVRGLQGTPGEDGVIATGKHFLGYGNCLGGLNMAANPVTDRELREVYGKPFQAAITEAGLDSIMNSYGTLDNELIIGSKKILTDLLREEMGFEGIVVSDYMSLDRMVDLKVAENAKTAGVKALRAGLDIELPMPFGYGQALGEAMAEGLIDIKLLDQAVQRILEIKLKYGLMEQPKAKKEWLADAFDASRTILASYKAAQESIVLLKNDGILPLEKGKRRIALIGPHADSVRLLFGCYTYPAQLDRDMSGSMGDMPGMAAMKDAEKNPFFLPYFEGSTVRGTAPEIEEKLREIYDGRTLTVLQALREKCPDAEIICKKGCEVAGTDRSGFKAAVDAAKEADVVIVCMGGKYGWGTNCTTGEGIDCDRIGLTGVQEELALELAATGTPSVFVHMDAKPLCCGKIADSFDAVLENWYPGETGGKALMDVLFGDYNPAGRLPITAPKTEGQIPVFHSSQNGSGYTPGGGMVISKYVEGDKEPLFYFGEGLSYTTFDYQNLNVTKSVTVKDSIKVSVDVTNTGKVAGDEVVQLYMTDEVASMVRPAKELAGFYRVSLMPGETKTICFEMKPSQFAFLDTEMNWIVEKGKMTVHVGGSSRDLRLTDSFEMAEDAAIDGRTRGFCARAYEQPV
ncbi:MAG: glycoside hydrolase family 3 C-terminal domain-containing protein [Lachnospiraceae bacterium]|nr:glycoside hydrolase family 3 C-terminal domain-containing protein [Lachnospiraceae bacterium]